jgi:hypothetical protein
MISVGRGHIAPPPGRLKVVLAHQPGGPLLVIDDHPSMPQFGAHASPAVGFELIAIAAIPSTIAVASCAGVRREIAILPDEATGPKI